MSTALFALLALSQAHALELGSPANVHAGDDLQRTEVLELGFRVQLLGPAAMDPATLHPPTSTPPRPAASIQPTQPRQLGQQNGR